MDNETIKKIENSIKILEEKKSRIYFLVQDTKGNAKGGVRFIYQVAKSLLDNGFNPIVLYDKKDYKNASEWLGEEYADIITGTIESNELKISPEDFLIIPELYGHVLEQVKELPCAKIIMCQSYDNMLETIQPGSTWAQFNFLKCITTSQEQLDHVKGIMKNVSFDIIKPIIPRIFTKKEKPSKPIITIHTRDQRDTMILIKTFYLKYPQFRWITFRDMRGLNQEEFSTYLKDSFVSVWIDDVSGFGTFPLESMASRTPVIGMVPNLKPKWMTDNNGIWTTDYNGLPDVIAEFTQNWLEDNISDDLYKNSLATVKEYQDEEEFKNNVVSLFESYLKLREDTFKTQIEKLKLTEEN